MKFTRTSPIIIPLALFLFFFIISISELFILHEPNPNQNYLSDNIFYYTINIITWLSGAFLLNIIISMFIWGAMGKPKTAGIETYFVDFVAILIYAIALIGIATITLDRSFEISWFVALLLFLIIGTLTRRKFLSLFKGTFFVTESPYSIGDWIEVKGSSSVVGEVIDISRRTTKLITEDGTVAIVPNQLLYDEVVINYCGTKKEIKVKIKVTLDYSVSVERVKRIIYAGIKDTTYFSSLLLQRDSEILIENTNDVGVVYSIGVWVMPWDNLSPNEIKDLFYTSILKHLSFAGISLAYPKNDIYYNRMPTRVSELNNLIGIKEILSKNELLALFSDKELEQIAEKVSLSQFRNGDYLINQNDEGDSMFILVEGLVEVISKNEKNIEIKLGTVSPGQYFGEMSLLTGDPRSASVKAVTDTALYEIKKHHLQDILNERPQIVELLSSTVAERKESNIQKIEEASFIKESFYKELLGKIKTFFKV